MSCGPNPYTGPIQIDPIPGGSDADNLSRTPITERTVFVIMMENHDWKDILGNTKSAPFINNTLLKLGSYAGQYYNPPALHPSLPNYLWLEAGLNLGVHNDNGPGSNHQSTTTHLVTQFESAHLTWKAYQEDITGIGCPLGDHNNYAVRHNPVVYFDDVTDNQDPNSKHCEQHVRPYSELKNDLANNAVPNYNFITPDLCHDMHGVYQGISCNPLTTDVINMGDNWLAKEVPTIMNSTAYKNGGVLFILFDEGEKNKSDGPIGAMVFSPAIKPGYNNNIHYTHSSYVRSVQKIFNLTPYLGDAAAATDLSDLFLRAL